MLMETMTTSVTFKFMYWVGTPLQSLQINKYVNLNVELCRLDSDFIKSGSVSFPVIKFVKKIYI